MFAVQISFAIPLFVQPCFRGSPIVMAAQGEFPPDMAHTADLRLGLPQPIWLKKIAAKCTKSYYLRVLGSFLSEKGPSF